MSVSMLSLDMTQTRPEMRVGGRGTVPDWAGGLTPILAIFTGAGRAFGFDGTLSALVMTPATAEAAAVAGLAR
jgi:hypothetical protein